MDDLIVEFLGETSESLDVIDVELVKFENDPTDRATLDNIFRLLHTIKGTCGFLGLTRLEALAHAGETLLGKFRDGDMIADSAAVTVVLKSIDRTKDILGGLEETGAEPAGDDSDLITQLEDLAMRKNAPAPAAPPPAPEPEPEPTPAPVEAAAPSDDRFDSDLDRPLRPGEVSLAELEAAFQNTDIEDAAPAAPAATPQPSEAGEERTLRPGEVSLEDLEAAFLAAEGPDDIINPRDEVPAEPVAVAPAPTPAPPAAAPAAAAPKPAAPAPKPAAPKPDPRDDTAHEGGLKKGQSSIRVSVDVLESLMTTVSELVLARNQLHQIVRDNEDSTLKTPLQRLSSVTAELQDGVMKTRMQPVGDAWRKLPRIVRDISQDLGKSINLVMEGEETELDRQVLELIKDPLTHMVRNSADHGLETKEQRKASGKSEVGTIKLSAYHEGGAIIMKISDDGAGLNTERIAQKAVEKGLISEDELATMSEGQIHRFIFAAGFSTAAQVTNLSGRGVGMDVVRTNIEQIGGSIDVMSERGKGTTFAIKIPLTLAIVSALIVKAGEDRYAVPQLAVRELVRVGPGSDNKVEAINGAHMIRLRDRLLPVVSVHTVLQTGHNVDHINESGYVILVEAAGRKIGLIVDDVLDTEEIVVKPLSGALRGINVYSGATILGDGAVIMILDPNGVVQEVAHSEEEGETETAEALRASTEQRQRLLLVKAGGAEAKAVPVSLITRLEEFDAAKIEVVDGQHVVQYRERLLPLVHISGMDTFAGEGRQAVLVFSEEGRSAGVAVDEIMDVAEETLDLQLGSQRPGIIGSAIIKGKATEVIDIAWHMERAWSGAPERRIQGRKSILLVDADAFARRMMAPLLAAAGYDVTVAGSLHEARDAGAHGAVYSAIVGDPAALSRLAQEGYFAEVPRLGISSEGAYGASYDSVNEVISSNDRGGIIAALDRAAQSDDQRAA
ncbi:chemotaxis protein CheA [Woodsholea maritima]|uniref:chemotaxis protein CheA n=1 Tax=Woodsholea maritima TaxID=240237 RepID=UPI00036A105A|nr:chemotaxis protein CheA [Woodsholea maritima]